MTPSGRVADLAEQIRGVTYGREDASPIRLTGYLPVLRAGNIQDGSLAFDDLVFVPAERISDRQKIRRNDVVVATSSGSLDVVGKAARALADYDGGFGAFCKVLRPGPDIDPGYFGQFFTTPGYRRRVSALAAGANINNLRHEHLDDMEIPLPPLSKQRRIAEILDTAEALRTRRRAALAQLDKLTESIFLDMFTRDLDGPAVDVSIDRLGLRKGWAWELLTDAARLATGHTPDREREDYWNGDIPWISLTDIRDLDGTVATETIQRVTPRGIENSSSVRLPSGTVCFSRTASVGFVTVMGREMATSQDFVNWVCGPRLDPTYLMHALIGARRRLRALSSGSTHKTIYVRVVEQFRALIPPIAVQHDFARRVGAIERLRSATRASMIDMDALFASLQHRAFRGEL